MGGQEILHTVFARVFGWVDKYTWTQKYSKLILANKDISELVRGSGVAFVLKLVSLPLGLLTGVIISRWYGAEAMGLYGLVLTVVGILVSIGALGLNAAMPRFLGEIRAKRAHNSELKSITHESGIYRTSLRMMLLSGVVISGGLYFCSGWIAYQIFDEPKLVLPLQVAALFVIPLLVYHLNTSFLLAAKKVYHSELITKAIIPIAMLLIVFGSYWVWPTYYIPIWAYLITGGCGMIVSLYMLRKHKYVAVRGELADWRKILRISGPMLVTGMAGMIIGYSDILMLGGLGSTEEVGIYKVILSITSIVYVGRQIIFPIIANQISEGYRKGDMKGIQYQIKIITRVLFFSSLVLCVGLIGMGKYILTFWGKEFGVGYHALIIISASYVAMCFFGFVGEYLNTTGKQTTFTKIMLISGTINIVLNYILIPKLGITGAAIGFAVGFLSIYSLGAIYIKKVDKITVYLT